MHEAEGHQYLVREHLEELLWWFCIPSLLRLHHEEEFEMAVARMIQEAVDRALDAAEEVGYRLDLLLQPGVTATATEATEE